MGKYKLVLVWRQLFDRTVVFISIIIHVYQYTLIDTRFCEVPNQTQNKDAKSVPLSIQIRSHRVKANHFELLTFSPLLNNLLHIKGDVEGKIHISYLNCLFILHTLYLSKDSWLGLPLLATEQLNWSICSEICGSRALQHERKLHYH